jgi:hypothetical protein
MVEGTEPYLNSISKPNNIHKPRLFNILRNTQPLQTAGLREKFNSLHFHETENGRGFDSLTDASCNHSANLSLNTTVSQRMS